jgi:hypothetical protein
MAELAQLSSNTSLVSMPSAGGAGASVPGTPTAAGAVTPGRVAGL